MKSKMTKEIETKLIECHILMHEALKGYEDRALMSNKLFEVKQYSNQLPEDMKRKIMDYADEILRPMVYDTDYWSFVERDEQYGYFDDENHFIIDSDRSLECIIFTKYHHMNSIVYYY